MSEYKAFLAEAAKRDHRKIGKVRRLSKTNDLILATCTGAGALLLQRPESWQRFLAPSWHAYL